MSTSGSIKLMLMLCAGAWAQGRGRLSLSIAVVACGVALGVAVHTVNFSAASELQRAVRSLSGDADLSVRAGRPGFSEDLYPQLATRPEVAAASPVLEIEAKLAGKPETLRIEGIDPLRSLVLQPALLGDASDRLLDLLRHDAIMLTTAAAAKYGIRVGETLKFQIGLRNVDLRVIAILPVNDSFRQPLALMDIASAQWVFERLGQISRIDLRLNPGDDTSSVARRINSILPAGTQAMEPAIVADQGLALSRAYRVNLNVLALVSLFTGAVLIFSVQVLSTLRRRTHFALLRALGLMRRQLLGLLVAEAAAIGLLGTVLGLLLGIVAARATLASVGSDLGAGYFQDLTAPLSLDPWGLGLIVVAGIAVCTLGGAIPAWEAANAAPAQALRAGNEQQALDRLPRPLAGALVLAIGMPLLLLPSVDELPLFGYAAMACLLFGAMLLMPWYVHRSLHAIPRSRVAAVRLAFEQLRGAHAYAGISLATLLASFSFAVAMLIMIHSFRHSLDSWLNEVLPADLYARAGPSAAAWLDPTSQERMASAPGIRRIVFSRHQTLQLDAARPAVTLIARDLDPARPEALPLIAPSVLPPESHTPVWISEAMHSLYGIEVGGRLVLPLAGRSVEVTVAGIWRDYIRQGGAVLMNRADYLRLTTDRLVNDAWIWLAPGQPAETVAKTLREALGVGPEIELRDTRTIRALSLGLFDRTFAVTYALQVAALVIALFGVGIGFSAQAHARRSEFGMLRHLGMTRSELGAMLAVEGALLGTLGALAGLIVGAALSHVLVHVINRQSFHWSMDMHWPVALLTAASSALIVSCAATAAVSARAALAQDAIQAVREDW